MKDTPYSLLQSAKSFFSGTMASRLTGMARDIAMASVFGTEATLAAFFVAFRLAHLLRRLLGEGALQAAFIPHFEQLKDKSQASDFFIDLYGSIILLLLCIIGLLMGGFGWLLQSQMLSAGSAEIALFTLAMLPSALFICLFGLNASLLQCEKHYFLPSFAPVAFNVIWIAALPFIKDWPLKSAMLGLCLAVCLACFAQWLITLPTSFVLLKKLHGKSVNWYSCQPFSSSVRALLWPLVLGMAGVAATQINSALDMLFARYADAAGPAFLWFAIRLAQLPLALFGIALSSALLPALARALKSTADYCHLLQAAVKQTIALMLPLTFVLIVLSHSGISLLYGWSDAPSVAKTSYCLIGYALGLIPQALVIVLAPVFYSHNNYALPAKAALLAVLLNALLNCLMVFGLHWGAFSIAIATALSAWGNFLFLVQKLNLLKQNPLPIWIAFRDGLALSAWPTLVATTLSLLIDTQIAFTSHLGHFLALAFPFGLLFILAAFSHKRLFLLQST